MTDQYTTKLIDEEGLETLNAIANANLFNKWMYSRIAPYCAGHILEIGSGIGNISACFLKNKSTITLSDLRDNYLEILKEKFNVYPTLQGFIKLDLVDPDFDQKFNHLLGTFDTVYALNVIEHINDDVKAIANCKKLLKVNGTLVILVPAYQLLYNRFDKELEHFRRYTRSSLNKLMLSNDLKLIRTNYFNLAGIPAWFLFGRILNKKTIESGPMNLYNKLVPFLKLIDKIVFNQMGLSVICIAIKR